MANVKKENRFVVDTAGTLSTDNFFITAISCSTAVTVTDIEDNEIWKSTSEDNIAYPSSVRVNGIKVAALIGTAVIVFQ